MSICVIASALSLVVSLLLPQTPNQTARATKSDETPIKLNARLVNLNIKVVDPSGRPVQKLRREDFTVLEDNVLQEVSYFEPVAAPVNLLLLLDLSGSIGSKLQAMKKAAREHAAKIKPIADMGLTAESYRERLAVLAAEYAKFRLDPEPPTPVQETYSKFNDPEDALFTRLSGMDSPLRLLEKLLIPKVMKGAREVWVYLFCIVPVAGLTAWQTDLDVTFVGTAAVIGGVLGFHAR